VFLLALGAAFVADRLTKAIVGRWLAPGRTVSAQSVAAWLPVRLRHVEHHRLVVSRTFIALCLLPTVVGAGLLTASGLGATAPVQIGLGLAVGGAVGNAIDILSGRPVVDFVDLRVWPVFNLADAAIACGIALTLWGMR
jgi:signal peptidase II